jgi:hypothetical protein
MTVSATVSGNISLNDLNETLPIQPTPPLRAATAQGLAPKGKREQRRLVGRRPWFLLWVGTSERRRARTPAAPTLAVLKFCGFNG